MPICAMNSISSRRRRSAMPERLATPMPLERQRENLEQYQFGIRISEKGSVVSVGDGIAWVHGLPDAAMEEMLLFADGSRGLVFHLTETLIGAILLQQTEKLTAGVKARLSGRALRLPVGDALSGRVIDPLGRPLDTDDVPDCNTYGPMEAASPPVTAREFVHDPLYTGIKIIDTMIPIGKGQRQLLIGDEGTGRSSLALDTVINQRGAGVNCVYVLIGQKRSAAVRTLETLRKNGAMEYTTVVVGEATSLPGLQYLAPYAGCAVAEYWMNQGRNVLVVYDDLSTHARTYRELSLLLRRPPGREAYPGDIFYLHARLLERATCLNAEHGGGSMTALPIVETLQGEIASYIPTNLISITDGQIYLDRSLFDEGFRPAIDVSRSVSRVGGKAQHPRIKAEAGRMKLDYLQFLELEVFTRFGARLEQSMEQRIRRGRVLRTLLKQDRLKPLTPEAELAWLIAFNDGYFDSVEEARLPGLLEMLESRVRAGNPGIDDPRESWVGAIKQWLARGRESAP